MNDLVKEVEAFKEKIESANQFIDESKRLIDALEVAVEKVSIFEKNATDLEEKYVSINKANDLVYQDLYKKQHELLNNMKIKFTDDVSRLEQKVDEKISMISKLIYLIIGLIVICTLVIKFV